MERLQSRKARMTMLTLEYKLDGTAAQYAAIEEGIRVVQFIRNKCLRAWMDRDPEGKSFATMSAYTAVLAKEFAFAGQLGSQARQASAERAWNAIKRFYDNCKNKVPGKKGYPKFQHDCRSIEYKETAGWHLESDGKHITFSDGLGIGRVRLVGTRMKNCDKKKHKPLRSLLAFPLQQIKRVRIIRRADGYFCQFCIDAERHIEHVPTGKQTGIDVGLNAYYADSDGNTVENPRFFRKAERKVAVLQRQVSRKSNHYKDTKKPKQNHRARKRQKRAKYPKQPQPIVAQTPAQVATPQEAVKTKRPQSNHYQQARKQLAQAHLKVQRQREDHARKLACALVTSTDLIAFEDLQVRNLVKNHHLAKSISDAGWSTFLGWVRYYAQMHGIPCVAVPPAYTSQACSGCHGLVKKSLSVRTHCCPHCGLIFDRDVNPALNILAAAIELVRSGRPELPRFGGETLGDSRPPC